MSNWTDERKEKVKQMYLDAEPTAETSTEIVKDIAEQLEESPNGVRMVLVQAGVYLKKDTASTTANKPATKTTSTRVSKDSQIAELKKAILAAGKEVDDEILTKLTGKAAAYFTTVLSK